MVDEAESALRILGAALHVSGLFIGDAANVISHGKFGIDRYRAIEQRDGGAKMSRSHDGKAVGVTLKSFERRSGGLFQRSVVFAYRAQRFAGAFPKVAGDHGERVEHVFFAGDLRLLLIQNFAIATAYGLQAESILGSEARDRAFKNGSASGALADLRSEEHTSELQSP